MARQEGGHGNVRPGRGHGLGQPEGVLDDAEHLRPAAFDDRLQAAQFEPGQADAACGPDDLEAEVGEEVLREDRLVNAEALVARLALGVAIRERLQGARAAVARLADRREEERLEHPRARLGHEIGARHEHRVVRRGPTGQLLGAREELGGPVLHRAEHIPVGVVVDRPERPDRELDLLHPAVLVDRAPAARLPPDAVVAHRRRRLERELGQPGERRRQGLVPRDLVDDDVHR